LSKHKLSFSLLKTNLSKNLSKYKVNEMHFKIYPTIGFYYGNKMANFGVPILDENRCFVLSLTFINLKYVNDKS